MSKIFDIHSGAGFAPPARGSLVASGAGLDLIRAALGAENVCKRDITCTDFKPEHRAEFSHPTYDGGKRLACTYGARCYQKNITHLRQFVHPGDRTYREGLVEFGTFRGKTVKPTFPSVRDLFNYCDPDESGNISKDEFKEAWGCIQTLPSDIFNDGSQALSGTFEEAWLTATRSQDCSHLTFAQFAKWASDVGVNLPVGVDIHEGVAQQCRFEYSDRKDGKCPCVDFKAAKDTAYLCECGHKKSCHLSDAASMTVDEQQVLVRLAARRGSGLTRLGSFVVKPRRAGFDMVTDKDTLADLQKLLSSTIKTEDNWTRDRGCTLHGRNNCEARCIFSNRTAVPKGYELIRAERNRNDALWQTFSVTRSAIRDECHGSGSAFRKFSPLSAIDVADTEPLDPDINEWRLFHGTGLAGCKGICGSNFKLKMAGTGATWKSEKEKAGTPLYGWGVYLAERSTKSDEYAEEITKGLPIDVGCHAVLICRAVGGLSRLVDTNEFDTDDLRTDVFDGPYHSVFGDREAKLGKPFKEIVVYDHNQIFPEFILYYKRTF